MKRHHRHPRTFERSALITLAYTVDKETTQETPTVYKQNLILFCYKRKTNSSTQKLKIWLTLIELKYLTYLKVYMILKIKNIQNLINLSIYEVSTITEGYQDKSIDTSNLQTVR